MADIDLTTTWQTLVATGNEFLLSFKPTARANMVEIVATTADEDPTTEALHILRPCKNESMSRGMIGPGYIQARLQSSNASVTACVTAWTS